MGYDDFGTVNMAYAGQMAMTAPRDDGPIFMVNFMRYKERASYGDGESGTISGREADDRYAPVNVLAAIGADVAFFGDVEGPEGASADVWHRMGIVRYPTRKSFIDMQSRQDFKEKVVHKEAGMEFTIVSGCRPRVQVVGGPDGSGVVRFVAYRQGSEVPVPEEGVLLEVEGTVIGDERIWSHILVSWADRHDDLPEGAMEVRTRPSIDRLSTLIAASLGDSRNT